MIRDARLRALLLLAVVALVAPTAPGRITGGIAWNDANRGDDFGLFYDSATCLIVTGCPPYDLGAGRAPNLNAPHTHLLFAPLLPLPRPAAYRVWLVLGLLSVVLALIRLARAVPLRLSAVTWGLVAIGLLSSGLVSATVRTGQVYPVLAWPLTEAYLAARSGRWSLAGGITAVLATMKPPLLLPLAWIAWKQPRAVVAIGASAAAALGVGIAVFGIGAYLDWRESLSDFALSGHWWDGSILQSLTRTFGASRAFAPVVFVPEIVRPLWALLSALVLVNLWRRILKGSTDVAWLGLMVVMVLIAPKGWLYMGWFLLAPGAVVARESRWSLIWCILGCLLLLPDTTPLYMQPNRWLSPTIGSLYCWTWVTMFVAAARAARGRVAVEDAAIGR